MSVLTFASSLSMMPMAMAAGAAAKPRAASSKAVPSTPPALSSLKGNALLGKDKSDAERCQECHGVDGNGQGPVNSMGKFAKLAGQYPAYALKQLEDFRSGARKHDQMSMMARSVSDEDLADIAAYFGSLPVMKGEAAPASVAQELGKKLYLNGDPARGVIACVACHGEQGKGVPATPLVPILGGQERGYLDKQLLDWRSGERHNSPGGLMNQGTKALTDAELQALSSYLVGL